MQEEIILAHPTQVFQMREVVLLVFLELPQLTKL